MELRQLYYFMEVAKREHVTDAANSLHVAQSAVSRQIANLESELGVQLFIREGRNVKLTQVGHIFMDHAETAISEIERARQAVFEFLNPDTGTIRIGFPNSLAAKTLPTVISAFRKEHPSVGFQLRQGSVQDLTDAVSKGEIDIAFVSPVPKDRTDVDGHIFFTEKLLALLPISHPLADYPMLRLGQLKNEPFVLFRSGYALHHLVTSACQQVGFKPRIAFEGEDIDTIKGLVAAGLGVSLLPEITLSEQLPGETVKIELSEPNVTRTVGVIIPQGRELAPSERKFFEFLTHFYEVLNRIGQ
ncbi:LysR family transcriptional regulator [Guptibacillus hwajinpoensis]|uniref:LysR family transcriptional regulator n=1 Tax=Guptibacillus hwajinpoensis TaxID=208199 RepID=UPI003CFCE0DA